ncbi:MAG TPA: hypothetical protein VGH79_11735 [Gaiellaceae bacterium]|jgi:hypothetical protein
MPTPTRVEAGKRRAQLAKRTVALTAATGFAVALALVRQGHPATATSSSTRTGSQPARTRSFESDDGGGPTFGGGSIAPPSSVTPPVATATS